MERFVPEALGNETLKPASEAIVIERGLEMIQETLDVLKKGVSARKGCVKR